MISVATTSSSKIHYVEEREADPVTFSGQRTAELVARDWDVDDLEARAIAAEEQLGEGANDDDWYRQHAKWFINADANAAALIVFRPKVEANA